MKNATDKQLKTMRYLSYWLYVVFTIGIPIALIAWQFHIFKKPSPITITGWGVIAIVVGLFVAKGHIKRAIEEMDKGVVKTILLDLTRLFPWLCMWLILNFLKEYSARVSLILLYGLMANVIATGFDIWHSAVCTEIRERKKQKLEE